MRVFFHKLSQLEEAPAETICKNPKIFFPTDLKQYVFNIFWKFYRGCQAETSIVVREWLEIDK